MSVWSVNTVFLASGLVIARAVRPSACALRKKKDTVHTYIIYIYIEWRERVQGDEKCRLVTYLADQTCCIKHLRGHC